MNYYPSLTLLVSKLSITLYISIIYSVFAFSDFVVYLSQL